MLRSLLSELKTKAEKATAGPWHVGDRYEDEFQLPYYPVLQDHDPDSFDSPEETICEVWGAEHDGEANSAFIAAANPDLIQAMLALIEMQHNALIYDDAVARTPESTEIRALAFRAFRMLTALEVEE